MEENEDVVEVDEVIHIMDAEMDDGADISVGAPIHEELVPNWLPEPIVAAPEHSKTVTTRKSTREVKPPL